MKYGVLYRIGLDKKNAEYHFKKMSKEFPEAELYHSERSNSWLVLLYTSDSEEDVRKALSLYRTRCKEDLWFYEKGWEP